MKKYLLTGTFIGSLFVGLFFAHAPINNAEAAIVTEKSIRAQEKIVRSSAEDTIRAYIRLLLYAIIIKLEAQGATL